MATIKPITPQAAARHEALYLRLATMLRQTEAGANKRADAPVDDITRRLAEDLLFETRRFSGGSGAIPASAPDMVGLATQLGQALAALDAYEACHSVWDPALGAFVWSVNGPVALPIARLRPKANAPSHPDLVEIVAIQRRQVLAFAERFEQAAKDGAKAAAEPPR
ncbi:hypothetical protein ABIB57_003398 [Devosia sp. UYZn731]|uniref:hypothetical protein n=1 Tax=Devosia sp. UYZn731 TaxID=3156345 RepID=UPI003399CADE